jgi:cell division protein ZapA
MADSSTITVTILDREFRVSCPPEEQQHLIDSAEFLDKRMREIRDTGRVIGVDRIAMMAALNLTSELLSHENVNEEVNQATSQAIDRMADKIDRCLHETESLDL